MATVGIDRVYLGLFDQNGNILTDEENGFTTVLKSRMTC